MYNMENLTLQQLKHQYTETFLSVADMETTIDAFEDLEQDDIELHQYLVTSLEKFKSELLKMEELLVKKGISPMAVIYDED